MTPRIEIRRLQAPVAVTYTTLDGQVYARALQFDIVGIGKNRQEALRELGELFADYVEEFLNSRGPVQFSHPAEGVEWDNPDKEFFAVTIVFSRTPRTQAMPAYISDPKAVRQVRESIEAIQLQPLVFA